MIDKVKEIVRQASELMSVASFDITQKDGFANIVTSADVAVQKFLIDALGKLLPGSGFFCEEEDRHHEGREYTWIIDPIDGTANFSRGIDQCAISVGLRHFDDVELGVVYLPRTGEMFSAVKGGGAWLNDRPIHVSSRPFVNGVLCTALPVYHKEHAPECSRIIERAFHEINDIRRFGAAAPELCYLAMGRSELYFEYLLSPWDYAGASIILQEAGGVITNLELDSPSLSAPSGIIAANSIESLRSLHSIVSSELKKS